MFNAAATSRKICLTLVLSLFPVVCFGGMETYVSLPPFINADVKGNVLLVMDYSGSMQFPANYGNDFDGYGGYVADCGDPGEVSTSYDNSTSYYGYFDPSEYYEYDSSNDYWEIDGNPAHTDRVGDADSVSGNLLNFLVMTRVDVSLKALIGGKADCPNNRDYCILRPQGSRRYVDVNIPGLGEKRCYVRPDNTWWQGDYLDKDMLLDIEGWFEDRYARLRIDKEDRSGIVQENFDQVRFAFIPYSTSLYWPIRHGVHNADMQALISELEETIPYNGTPTGEAVREAYRYLRQDDLSWRNQDYEDRGGERDPYYEENDGELEAAWCRQSSVVLISDGEWNGNVDPDEYAYKLHTKDLRTSQAMSQEQNADVYSLFTFSDSQQGENSMKTVAAFGNFEEMAGCDSGWPYTFDGYGGDSKYVNYPRSRCTPGGTYDDCCAEWDKGDKDGVPDAYFAASNGQEMAEALTAIFSEIKQGVASGTSITALTAKETTGSLINQAAFYPEKDFGDNNKVLWTGDIFGDWYLNARIDGNAVQNIREDYPKDYDSLHERGNLKLDVGGDNILKYLVEQGSLRIESYTAADNGTILTPNTPDQVYHSIEDVHSLYSCGEKLRDRNATSRDIYSIDEGGNFVQFSPENGADFESLLGTDWTDFPGCLVDSETPQYEDLIRYARGEHISGCRSRASGDGEWKLGDIIYSTPVAVEYDDYSMLYAGGNDGMLHAFRAGYVKNLGGQMQPAQICASRDSCSDGPNQPELGREEWAFIPQDSLPYLRYTASPDYSHIYSVDLKPSLVQTENRKILIGGMRLGGACGNGDINPPSDTEPESVGRSAYYALDVTNPQDPEYLWSFAPKDMGFTYSGPAYVKRKDENGDWSHYIMFASGPTGYDGTSEQKLRIFTVDLTDGPDGYNATYETNIKDAFGGRLLTEGMDVNEDGQTDFVFLGYTNNTDGRYSEMDGGVIKIFTGSADPSEWDYQEDFLGSSVEDPVTAPVVFMDCFPDEMDFPYIYFGTGRYFVSDDKTQDTNQDYNYLYGVPFTCNATNEGCATISNINDSSELGRDDLDKANTNPNSASWKVPLDEAGGAFYRERCYSTPSTTDHDTVFFSTNMPTSEICECGGQSRSWALNCASGRSLQDDECDRFTVEASDFKYLVQLSGGDIKEYGAGAFSEEDGRATPWAPGVSSEESGIPSFSPGSLAGEIIYWREW